MKVSSPSHKTSMENNRDWSQLPHDLLSLIVGKLSRSDAIHFGCVCTQWHEASKSITSKPMSPWLIMAGQTYIDTLDFIIMSDYTTKTTTTLINSIDLPDPSTLNRYCIGCSHGCLITVDTNERSLHLLCPLNGVQIPLPPLDDFTSADTDSVSRNFFTKAALSALPTFSPRDNEWEFTVMTIYVYDDMEVELIRERRCKAWAFTRGGCKEWVKVDYNLIFDVDAIDLIGFDGKFYTMESNLRVMALECENYDSIKSLEFLELRPVAPRFISSSFQYPAAFTAFKLENPKFMINNKADDRFCLESCDKYLAKSVNGKLLAVLREYTSHSDVFKVLWWNEEKHKWRHLPSLGDEILFVGLMSDAVCLPTSAFPELRPNSIYFNEFYEVGCIGVFCMEEYLEREFMDIQNAAEHRYRAFRQGFGQFPVWFLPNY